MNRNRMLLRKAGGALAAAVMMGGMWFSPGTALAQYGALPVIAGQRAIMITGTITAIDPSTRSVTLAGPGGDTVVVRAATQVKNLEQLKPQDQVRATYYQSIIIAGKHAFAGQPGAAMGASQIEDERGRGQAMAGNQQTLTVVAKVAAIDKPAGKITLKGPRGNYRTFQVKDATLLTHFTIGDDVVFQYTEAWAVAIAEVAPAASSSHTQAATASHPSSQSAPAPAASPAGSSHPAPITPPAAQSATPPPAAQSATPPPAAQPATPVPAVQSPQAQAAAIPVPVPAGTQVGLTFLDPVDAAKTSQGDKVRFTVTADVIVNRVIVIRQGTPLEGTVTNIKRPGGIDNTANVTFGFLAVTAVDEKPLVLDDVVVQPPQRVFGGNVVVAPGGVVTARTKNDATVSVPAGTP